VCLYVCWFGCAIHNVLSNHCAKGTLQSSHTSVIANMPDDNARAYHCQRAWPTLIYDVLVPSGVKSCSPCPRVPSNKRVRIGGVPSRWSVVVVGMRGMSTTACMAGQMRCMSTSCLIHSKCKLMSHFPYVTMLAFHDTVV
jgi:hypothetical protein